MVQTLADLLGHPVEVDFVASSVNPAMNATQLPRDVEQTPTPLALQYEAERDPQLSPALDLFEAKILKIELK